MQYKLFLFTLVIILSCFSEIAGVAAADEEILIIVNKDTPITSMGLSTLIDIYTNTKTKWESNKKIHICMLKAGPVHEAFSNQLIGLAPKKLVGIWKKVIFTGLGTPPKIVKSEAEMIQYVSSTKGAIGYISASTPPENVHVLRLK